MHNDREDHDLGFAHITRKVMENGEIRTRMALPEGVSTTFTRGGEWNLNNRILPWQKAHLHKGLTETYTVFEGWMFFVRSVLLPSGCRSFEMDLAEPNQTVIFEPGSAHNILLGPSALIQTTVVGVPVPNPENKGNDWYADPHLDELTRNRPMFVAYCRRGRAQAA